ncbi:hypothetical protein K2X30_15220 [bacterium]|jgi:hypothetical protein|nr:hypothetical protein [bacterium]
MEKFAPTICLLLLLSCAPNLLGITHCETEPSGSEIAMQASPSGATEPLEDGQQDTKPAHQCHLGHCSFIVAGLDPSALSLDVRSYPLPLGSSPISGLAGSIDRPPRI